MKLLTIILHLFLVLTITARNSIDFVDGAQFSVEYTYDGNGSLTSDANKGISLIEYDDMNMPRRIQFANGNKIDYVYTAEGKKLRTIYYTASTEQKDSTEYLLGGLLTKKNNNLDKYLYDGGYFSFSNNTPTSHYYNRDHLGNIREVISQTGAIEQVIHYYPFGMPYSDSSVTNPSLQPYKYNGKEFDTVYRLNTYDYGARQYDPVLVVWHGVDPLCEKDYTISTSVYCRNNPVKLIDTDGEVPTIVVGAIVGAGMDYSLQVITNVFSGKGISSFTDVDGKSIMISAVAGAAGGGLISKAEKLSKMTVRVADVAINASEGVASTVNDKISNGEKVTVADVAKGAAKGGVAGAVGEKAGEIKRNITLKSPKQKMLNQQADHYRRVARGPNARKSRVESAQKSQQTAKENMDNHEVAASTAASNIINEFINLIEESLK